MKTHLTDSEILDLAFTELNIANPNVDKIMEMAELMDLEYDEEKDAYHNPKWLMTHNGCKYEK